MPHLNYLLNGYNNVLIQGNPETNIENVAYDSRKVDKNTVFLCIKGFNVDGHEYIAEAIYQGATAIVLEDFKTGIPDNITVIKVENTRNALAYISSRFYGIPSSGLKLIGITGTRGKTAAADILNHLLSELLFKTGTIGTKGVTLGSTSLEMFKNTKTTPESLELNNMIYRLKTMETSHVIIEVTSHALALERVEYCEFETGLFTNIYPEHLDFHGTMDNYRNSKLKLFAKCKNIVANADDILGERILSENKNTISYSVKSRSDFKAENIRQIGNVVNFTLNCHGKKTEMALELTDSILLYNYLAAFAACYSLGLDACGVKLKERV